ncbi:MAG: pyridoxal-phosphate dependent enzyme [Bacteroidia bacterium]|nr:pyridoxal-phosphate dependent enzyme [Bacteroidia bacterium]
MDFPLLFEAKCEPSLLPQTRVHKLREQPFSNATLWVKREDEAGFAVAGGKLRKYASLLPALQKRGIREVAVIGNEAGNNVAGLAQFLTEWGIQATFFLKKSHAKFSGNRFLLQLLQDQSRLIYPDPKTEWPQIESIEAAWKAENPLEREVIPEGAACTEALAGACTLYSDIQRNEAELGLQFDHIFLDSGTGFTAAANILHHSLAPKAQIQVVLLAGKAGDFELQLENCAKDWENEFHFPAPVPTHFSAKFAETARSFGSVNQAVLDQIRHTARTEGILLDPIYSAKLFLQAQKEIARENLQGNILLVHSGGGVSLLGCKL